MATKIFVFINTRFGDGDVASVAVSEDGRFLASHISSGPTWAKHDMGLTSNWKHEMYAAAYPEGWELEWVEESAIESHAGLQAAIAKHAASSVSE